MIDSKKTARLLGVSARRVRALAETYGNELGAEKIGDRWAFDEQKVITFSEKARPIGVSRGYKDNQTDKPQVPKSLRNI